MAEPEFVTLQVEDGVGTIRLDRPKMNAINEQLHWEVRAAAIEALGSFGGVRRRMQVRGRASGVTIYDDFAHHPTAIAATVGGMRQAVGGQRILAVLEPRSNTMKLGTMKAALPDSLRDADRTFCYAAASLGWSPAEALAPLRERASVHDDLDEMVRAIAVHARHGDHVVVMSNGGFGGVHGKILAAL